MCQGFNGTISWVTADDESDPVFGIVCREVTVHEGNLSKAKLSTLFKLVRDLAEHPFP